MVTTGKHFPGLGAATRAQNTDLGPVTLDVSLSQLRRIDELPFSYAINADVDMIMASWATYPGAGRGRRRAAQQGDAIHALQRVLALRGQLG